MLYGFGVVAGHIVAEGLVVIAPDLGVLGGRGRLLRAGARSAAEEQNREQDIGLHDFPSCPPISA